MQLHPVTSDDLNAYVDGQLSRERRLDVEAQVASQPELRRELEELQATSRLLAALPEFTPRKSFVLGSEYAKAAPVATPGKILQFMPIVRTLSVAATLVFMVVAGSLFFDINGDPQDNTSETFQAQNEIMSNSSVTESDGEASDHAEDANDQADPAAADDSSQSASEDNESSMTSRGDAASADEAPMEDLTGLQESDKSTSGSTSNQVAQSSESDPAPTSVVPTDDDDRTTWLWTSIAVGGLAIALGGLWFVLAQAGRQANAR
jgi:hypothetical protein